MAEDKVAEQAAAPCDMCGQTRVLRGWRGQDVCWECWDWWKLGRNAAMFWTTGIKALSRNEYGTGPDPLDVRQWREWGVLEDMATALRTLEDVGARYQALLDKKR